MLDLVIIYDIFTHQEMPHNNTLRSLREMIDRQSYHDFVFLFLLEKLIPELELATFHFNISDFFFFLV